MPAAKVANTETSEALDSLEAEVKEVIITIGEGPEQITFVQKPLSFFGKIEFFAVVGKAVEKILSDGGSLSELLDMPDYDSSQPIQSNVGDADVFIKALSKVIQSAPEIISDLYLVILAVPRGQRAYVAVRLEEELTDDQGIQILDTFVDQNWEVMRDFFSQKIQPLWEKMASKVQGSDQ